MGKNSGGAAAMRPDGRPVGTPFRPGQSGNPNGRPPGPDLSTRIKRILEGDEPLPAIIDKTIKTAVGGSRKPLDAVIIAGLLQSLQGDRGWAQLLLEHGFGKPLQRTENQNDNKVSGSIVVATSTEKDLLDSI